MKIAAALAFLCLALSCPAALICPAAQAQTSLKTRPAQAVPGLPPPAAATVRMCDPGDLSLATDPENGTFNGTSHSGILVVLRNLSSTACRVPAIPQLAFANSSGPLKATLQSLGFGRQPNGIALGNGPVVLPVVVAAGAELTSKLRWVSSEVYPKNVCIDPTVLSVFIGGKPQTTAMHAHLCGDAANGGVLYEATHFAPDPIYAPNRPVYAQ